MKHCCLWPPGRHDPINLARHDKIVCVQSLDLLAAQRDGRVTPAEADIGMMTFGFIQVTDVVNKAERFLKIAKAEVLFDVLYLRCLGIRLAPVNVRFGYITGYCGRSERCPLYPQNTDITECDWHVR